MIMVVVSFSGESRVEVRNSFSEEIGSGAIIARVYVVELHVGKR